MTRGRQDGNFQRSLPPDEKWAAAFVVVVKGFQGDVLLLGEPGLTGITFGQVQPLYRRERERFFGCTHSRVLLSF